MYSVALPKIVALLSLVAAGTPSTRSCSCAPFPFRELPGFFGRNSRSAGTAFLRAEMRSLMLFRYRRSMALCATFF